MNYQSIRATQERHRQAGGEQMGSLLWWSLNANRITHEDLESLAQTHSLPAHYLPTPNKPHQAFRRAWRQAASYIESGLMLRALAETDDEIVVALVREKANTAARDLDYSILSRIAFHRTKFSISSDKEHAVVPEIKQGYERHLDHCTDDIRTMMTSFLNRSAVRLRESGGVYFVPLSQQITLDALCNVVEEAGSNCCYQLPVFDTPRGRAALREAADKTLDTELQRLRSQLESFDLDAVRDSTITRKIKEFDELRGRVNLFSGILAVKAEAFDTKINEIQNALREKLGLAPVETKVPVIQEQEPQNIDPIPAPNLQTPSEPYSTEAGF